MNPIIKWPGGKRRLLKDIMLHIPPIKRRYYEPFAGGAAVMFALLEQGIPGDAMTVTDVCRPLISAYQTVQNRPGLLIEMLASFAAQHKKDGADFYYRVRDDLNQTLTNGKVEQGVVLAARFIYLNRTCYNGLWRVNADGGMNTPVGRYKNPDIVRADLLREASDVLTGVRFLCAPYQPVTTYMIEPGDVVYIDPPYYEGFTAYSPGGFSVADQEALARTVRRLADRGIHVVVSNSDCPTVRDLYAGFNFHTVQAARSINSNTDDRGPVGELIITSD